MIHFETKSTGKVSINFRHNLPKVVLTHQNNNLASMVHGLKFVKGSTECTVLLEDEDRGAFGVAYTHPYDQYKKETGREVSLKRALKEFHLTESEEREILVGYYSR
jgi:hypothetical protein